MPTTYIGTGLAPSNSTVIVEAPVIPLVIVDDDVKCSIEVDPETGLLNWVFNWMTTRWTAASEDQVVVSGDIDATLYIGFPDVSVSVTYYADAVTGDRWYEHKLVWANQLCQLGANYSYTAQSTGIPPTTSKTGRIKVCPQTN